jgi:hypothetical protein
MEKLSILELIAFKEEATKVEKFWQNAYPDSNDINSRDAEIAATYYNNVVTSIEGEILDRIEEMFGKIPESRVRLLNGDGKAEFCPLCACKKSGWVNFANKKSEHCANADCICHTANKMC